MITLKACADVSLKSLHHRMEVSFPAAGRHMTCLPTLKRSKGQSNYSERMTFTRRMGRFKTIINMLFNVTDWRASTERHEGNSGIHRSRRICVCVCVLTVNEHTLTALTQNKTV